MLPICVRTERVWPKLSSTQGIRANLVYIVSLGILIFSPVQIIMTNLLWITKVIKPRENLGIEDYIDSETIEWSRKNYVFVVV